MAPIGSNFQAVHQAVASSAWRQWLRIRIDRRRPVTSAALSRPETSMPEPEYATAAIASQLLH
jgi:hypothetical protein